MQQIAVISTDENPTYSFFAPITAASWMLRDYRPLLLLIGTEADWLSQPQRRLALQRSREVGALVHFIPKVDGIRTSTVAQCIRPFGASIGDFSDDTYVLLSDMDMLPLGPWIGSGRDPSKSVQIYYANAYADQPQPHFPICYIGARVGTWRDILRRERLLTMLADAPKDTTGAWGWDELWLSKRLTEWDRQNRPSKLQLIDRTFCKGEWRLDRTNWDDTLANMDGSLDGLADAHLIRPGYDATNWPRLRPLLEMAFPPSELAWIEEYRAAWCARAV